MAITSAFAPAAPRAAEAVRPRAPSLLRRVAIYLAELRRAGDAAARYTELKHAPAAERGEACRRVHDEFYR